MSGDTGFPVLDSRTSGLHVCSRDVSKDRVGQSWRFLLLLKISLFQTANKKNRINSKILSPMPQSPSLLVPRPQPAKRSEKGYWDENEFEVWTLGDGARAHHVLPLFTRYEKTKPDENRQEIHVLARRKCFIIVGRVTMIQEE